MLEIVGAIQLWPPALVYVRIWHPLCQGLFLGFWDVPVGGGRRRSRRGQGRGPVGGFRSALTAAAGGAG